MESRKITIVSTKTQKKSVINSSAETLAELKADLTAAGIDYTDMTFYEGTSKTELKTDESILPKDVPYTNRTTGETIITNELVFMLTNTNKKIKSGMNTERQRAYEFIKEHDLQKACLIKYGKNYTQCSTDFLNVLISEYIEANKAPEGSSLASNCFQGVDAKAREAIAILVDELYDNGDIIGSTLHKVKNLLNYHTEGSDRDIDSSYSDDEISKMFENIL
jgi:hypothetical protein